jgi:hypothetical protein
VELLALTVIGTVVGTIVAVEASAWMPHLSRRVLRSALSRLPQDLPPEVRVRWIEEIEADFACFADRPWGGLAFALGVRRKGAKRLATELKPRPLRAKGKGKVAPSAGPAPRYQWVLSHKSFGLNPTMPRYVRVRVYEPEEKEETEGDG